MSYTVLSFVIFHCNAGLLNYMGKPKLHALMLKCYDRIDVSYLNSDQFDMFDLSVYPIDKLIVTINVNNYMMLFFMWMSKLKSNGNIN